MIDAALELFTSNGYQKTMIIDIVKKTGAAKGTFYHYFSSKEAILEAICTRWATETATSFELESRQFTALSKLQLFITRLFHPNQLNLFFKRLCDEEQLNLYYKLWRIIVENVFNPLITDIIQQGNQEDTMHVASPKETTAFFWSTLSCVWEAVLFQEPSEIIAIKIKIAESLLERALDTKEGMLKLSLPSQGIA
ncbi:TetR/AcrR family transcriptional regulator [Paenibacillus kribbensis]|uniref:TetR/AcrR family transcriptional regulator n=1 Tax=Paenibacillus kribbensis TaxID=172713 RepID=UPI000839AAB3|nr:TetR/AcrR family transcriptional regulator [Paenibacillus kribbensis]